MQKTSGDTIVIVLANLMDKDGVLNDETRGRLELGYRVAQDHAASEIMFMGWDYRTDTELAISVAMKRHAEAQGLSTLATLHCNTLSRDTVGDAVFSALACRERRDRVSPLVVTSDYHVMRTKRVFEFVWGREISVFGARTPDPVGKGATEVASIAAFEATFDGIKSGDLAGVARRLLAAHPFYNGTAMPDRPFAFGADYVALVTVGLD